MRLFLRRYKKNRQDPSIAPGNLGEKLTIDEAAKGPGKHIMEWKLKDPRYPEPQWKKMEYVHESLQGKKTTIHYGERAQKLQRHSYKFKTKY